MSDEHKPHDDHGHGHGQDDHAAPTPRDAQGDAAPTDARVENSAHTSSAAATSGDRRPVWSKADDAPFKDVDSTPVYAQGKGGKKGTKSSGGAANEGWEIFKTIAFALIIALVLRILLFQPFTIPSASMEPNLYEGDYIVVSKWSYGYSKHSIPFSPPVFEGRLFERAPERGDIAVFKLPRDDRTDYIKRVIGLPGDRIQMIENVLHINGAAVQDASVTAEQLTNMYGQTITQANETLPGGRTFRIQDFGPGGDLDNTPVFEVPAGHYFMMGDNRDNSIDSRVEESAGVGFVPAENLIGKAEIILFSWSPGASLWNPVSWFANVRPSRFFNLLG
jgi:signal peptidase I